MLIVSLSERLTLIIKLDVYARWPYFSIYLMCNILFYFDAVYIENVDNKIISSFISLAFCWFNDLLFFIWQLCAVLALAMVAGWNSKGITYRDLNSHDFNFVSNITFFVASSVICIIILSATVVFILFRKPFIPPKIVSFWNYNACNW